MAKQEVRADLLLGRDTLSPGLIKAGRAAADAGGNVKDLSDKLRHLSDRTYDARLGLKGDKETGQTLDKLTAQLLRLSQRKVDPEVDLEGYLRTRAQITGIELALDRLDAKRTRIQIAVDKVAGLGFLQPGALGAAISLLPTLIPLTATVAAGAAAIGASFGAAAIGAAGFGLVAKSVLSEAASDSQKLQALQSSQAQQLASLQTRLGEATTKAQRRSLEQQIANLKASQARQRAALTEGWSKGYRDLLTNYQQFQDKWERISKSIAVPTLNVWLPVLTRGLQFLKPLIKPVADAFTLWGISLNTYFRDPAAAKHIKDMAAAFGNFAAQQLFRIGQFIKDIGQGIFNLGKDFAASGANFSSFGVWLSGIGDAFLKWSRSKKARDDVQGFMKFLHDEGPVVKGILSDLGKLLPGIFAGATTVGTLELQALGDFLNLIAGLPKGWQKGLTEAVGALLLLSKLGVVKVGLKLTGWSLAGSAATGAAEGAAGAGGTLAALQKSTGLKWVFRAGIAVALTELLVKPVLQQQSSGKGKNWWDNPFGTDKGKGALNSWQDLWHDIEHIFDTGRHWVAASWDRTWNDTIGKAERFGKAVVDSFKADWHDIAHVFDTMRHGIATAWDTIWRNTVTRAGRGVSDVAGKFRDMRGAATSILGNLRGQSATVWDTIWRNTVTRARNGIADVVGWFHRLPPSVRQALWGLGHMLYGVSHASLTDFLSGFRAVGGSVLKWLGGFVSSVISKVKSLLGIGSPSSVFHDIGVNMMRGLERGIKASAHKAANAARSAAQGATGAFADTGARSGSARLAQSFAASVLPRGWSFPALLSLWNQESGWNAYAVNPSSGAYGIPQSLGHGHPYNLGDYKAQIMWGINYIAGRYGSSQAAWAHEVAYNWYDKGGWLPPGLSLALNTTGRPEQVISGRGAGAPTPVVLEIRSSGRRADDLLVELIRDAVRVRGGGNVQAALGKRH